MEPGKQVDQSVVATSARIPAHVTERELAQVAKKCSWPDESYQQRLVDSVGPGNILSLQLQMEHVTEVFESLGEKNVTAERVADRAVADLRRYLTAGVAVGEHLADQLILPMALGKGGRFSTLKPSHHLRTNIDVVRKLSGVEIELTEIKDDYWEVSVMGGNFVGRK